MDPGGANMAETRRGVLRAVVIVAGVAALLVGVLWGYQRRFIYHPDTAPVPMASAFLEGARDVGLQTDDGLVLGAWFVPPEAPGRNLAVLVANGNAGNRASRVPLAAKLREAGFGVLLFDYRGYGGNSGRPTEGGLALDARAALRGLTVQIGVPRPWTIYLGESLGAGVVTELASEYPPAGLLLRSPFTDLAAVGQRHYPFLPVRLLLRDRYPVRERIAGIDVPTTVVFGPRDSIVPPGQSQQVADAAANLFETVPVQGADHNDPALAHGSELIAAVERLAEHLQQ
ncbi:MAG: alpha/beta hydrolase [Acidimicrobiia bacterium]